MKTQTLTKTQRNKIAIAEDVIAQIKLKKYRPTTGVYFSGATTEKLLDGLTAGDDLQEAVKGLKKGASCGVCALGSAFLSCVAVKDNYAVSEYETNYTDIDSGRMREKLEEFFEAEELGVIESCFEIDSSFIADAGGDTDEFDDVEAFTSALGELNDETRLLFIMQSIVNLDGNITLDGVKQQLLLAIVIDPKFKSLRESLNWF